MIRSGTKQILSPLSLGEAGLAAATLLGGRTIKQKRKGQQNARILQKVKATWARGKYSFTKWEASTGNRHEPDERKLGGLAKK